MPALKKKPRRVALVGLAAVMIGLLVGCHTSGEPSAGRPGMLSRGNRSGDPSGDPSQVGEDRDQLGHLTHDPSIGGR